jgi:hypothetical protein
MMIHDELRPDQLENYALIERNFEQKPPPADEVHLGMDTFSQSQRSMAAKDNRERYPRIVWIRISFENFGEVDTMNEKYQALVRIKCKW